MQLDATHMRTCKGATSVSAIRQNRRDFNDALTAQLEEALDPSLLSDLIKIVVDYAVDKAPSFVDYMLAKHGVIRSGMNARRADRDSRALLL